MAISARFKKHTPILFGKNSRPADSFISKNEGMNEVFDVNYFPNILMPIWSRLGQAPIVHGGPIARSYGGYRAATMDLRGIVRRLFGCVTSPGKQSPLTAAFWCDQILDKANFHFLRISKEFGTRAKGGADRQLHKSGLKTIQASWWQVDQLIQYAGWADTAIAPENGINYYRKVTSVMGDVHDFYRVFMAPGMAHCCGGAGPNAFGNGTSTTLADLPEGGLRSASHSACIVGVEAARRGRGWLV
jgi:hypothetical protein